MSTDRIFCLGEAMGEISMPADAAPQVAVGGDVFNTAVYLAHLGVATEFVSAVGDDPFGALILRQLRHHGVGRDFLATMPGSTGLYSISTDAQGERSFHYWRDSSVARSMLSGLDLTRLGKAVQGQTIYLSGITLWVLRAALADLFGFLDMARDRGCRIVFDGNFRPRLWQQDLIEARRAHAHIMSLTDLALMTYEDEVLLWGDKTPEAAAQRNRDSGAGTVVMKMGADPCLIVNSAGGFEVPVGDAVSPVDTTAAGDSFNAGFLSCWLSAPADLVNAARRGHQVAGKVIARRGAILPDADLAELAGMSLP